MIELASSKEFIVVYSVAVICLVWLILWATSRRG